ncbi:MAG TPA: flavin reductase family protein [Actinomycetota bacterium]
MNQDPQTLQSLLDGLDYPVYIVTAADEGERAGCLVGFATQCSLDPVRFLVCISKANRTFRVARTAGHLGVHLVPRLGFELAELFGGQTGDDVDKFARCEWEEGPDGVPLLAGCPDRFVGRILERTDAGDHVAFHLEPVEWRSEGHASLTFQDTKGIEAGHPA